MSDLARALVRLAPGAAWTIRGDELFWEANVPQPSEAAIAQAMVDVAWDDVRRERDLRLAACDWTQVADAPVDPAPWTVYRQQLRDVPQDFAAPDLVVWPTPPA